MTDLTKLAKGERCLIRSPLCTPVPENRTTVPCHYRQIGVSGAGLKSPDVLIAWGCMQCHDLVDARRHLEGYEREFVQLLHLQGVARTLAELWRRGWRLVPPGGRNDEA